MTSWFPVAGFLGTYTVSWRGVVRRESGSPRCFSARFLRPYLNPRTGYLSVALCRDGRVRRRDVHRIVASAFLGDPLTSKHQVNHKNGKKTDNRVSNLEWVTPREHTRRTKAAGLFVTGACHPAAKLTVSDVRLIRSLASRRWTGPQLADKFRVTRANICAILRRKTWTFVS